MNQPLVEVRAYRADTDKAFIYSHWLRNYKHSSYFAKRIRPVTFFAGHHAIIEHLLNKPTTKTIIACSPEDHDQIFGFLCYEAPGSEEGKPVVHFIYMKDGFRKFGIARLLFESASIDPNKMNFTHWTMSVDELIRKWPEMVYDPYKL